MNQVCGELARSGLIRRQPGPGGKMVNEWVGGLVTVDGSGQDDQAPEVLIVAAFGHLGTAATILANALQAGHDLIGSIEAAPGSAAPHASAGAPQGHPAHS